MLAPGQTAEQYVEHARSFVTSLSDLDLVHMFKEFKDDTEGLLTHLMKKPTPGRIAPVFYLLKAIS